MRYLGRRGSGDSRRSPFTQSYFGRGCACGGKAGARDSDEGWSPLARFVSRVESATTVRTHASLWSSGPSALFSDSSPLSQERRRQRHTEQIAVAHFERSRACAVLVAFVDRARPARIGYQCEQRRHCSLGARVKDRNRGKRVLRVASRQLDRRDRANERVER